MAEKIHEQQLAKLRREQTTLQADLAVAKSSIADLEAHLAATHARSQAMRDRRRELRKELEPLREKFKWIETELVDTEDQVCRSRGCR